MNTLVDACIAEVAFLVVVAVAPDAQHQAVVARIAVEALLRAVSTIRNAEVLHGPVLGLGKTGCDALVITTELAGLMQFLDGEISGTQFLRLSAGIAAILQEVGQCLAQGVIGTADGVVVGIVGHGLCGGNDSSQTVVGLLRIIAGILVDSHLGQLLLDRSNKLLQLAIGDLAVVEQLDGLDTDVSSVGVAEVGLEAQIDIGGLFEREEDAPEAAVAGSHADLLESDGRLGDVVGGKNLVGGEDIADVIRLENGIGSTEVIASGRQLGLLIEACIADVVAMLRECAAVPPHLKVQTVVARVVVDAGLMVEAEVLDSPIECLSEASSVLCLWRTGEVIGLM